MTLIEAKVAATKQRQVGRTDGRTDGRGRTGEDSTTRGRGESGNPAISLPGGLLVRIELRLPASRLRTRGAALSVHKRRRLPCRVHGYFHATFTAVSSEAWAKLRDWASVAGWGRLLLSGSVAHASLKTAVVMHLRLGCEILHRST